MYHTYLASNKILEEVMLDMEILSIKEAIEKNIISAEGLDISALSDEELNEPNGVMVLTSGYGLSIQRYEDEELSDIFNKKYLYEVELVADKTEQVAKVYELFYDYLRACELPIEIWEAKAGLEKSVEGITKELAQMKVSDLEGFLEAKHEETTRRLNLI